MLQIYKEFLDMQNGEDYEYEETYPWIIRFTFNKELMMESGIVMEDIYIALMEYDNDRINFIYSDDNSKELVGRVSIKADIKGKRRSHSLNGLSDQTDIYSIFKNIQENMLDEIVIKGIKDITNIVMSEKDLYEKDQNEIKRKLLGYLKQMVSISLMYLIPHILIILLHSNDIVEIYEVLGIEAVRELLIEQITEVVEYEGSYINDRHIEILCDIMTNRGFLTAINRQGINREILVPSLNVPLKIQQINLLRLVLVKKINSMVYLPILC